MLSKKDLNIFKPIGKNKIFLEVKGKYGFLLSFNSFEKLKKYLLNQDIREVNKVIQEVKTNLKNDK